MTFTEGSYDGVTSSDTAVVVVPSPSSSVKRIVKNVTIHNPMASESVNLTYYFDHGGSPRNIWKGTLNGGETLIDDSIRVLDDTDKSIMAILSSVPTTELHFSSSWGDDSP
jgi:hypothetical protein